MGKGFHMGEFVKRVLDEHQVKYAGLARVMEVSPQAVQGMFDRERIGDEVLMNLGQAARLDMLGMVRREQARVMGKPLPPEVSTVTEPVNAYGRRGMELVVNLDEFDEATQLKILRYLQQQEKKAR
jgi:hypothetical protein